MKHPTPRVALERRKGWDGTQSSPLIRLLCVPMQRASRGPEARRLVVPYARPFCRD